MTLGQFWKHDNSQAHVRYELSCMKCHRALTASLSCDDMFRPPLPITVERKQNEAILRGEEEAGAVGTGSVQGLSKITLPQTLPFQNNRRWNLKLEQSSCLLKMR